MSKVDYFFSIVIVLYDMFLLTAFTVAQWVEHRRDKPRTWVQILASVYFFICSVAFFLPLLPWRSVGRSNFDWGLQKLDIVDSNNDIQI